MAAGPNILCIVTTQWRAQACGFMGCTDVSTPALDSLAKRSLVFEQAVTPHPFGPFARAALLTGTPSPQNGVRDYFDPLPTGSRTIAHALNDRGYATAWFGKWHLWKRDPHAPLVGEAHARIVVPPGARGGFQLWEGFESGFLLQNPWLHGTRLPQPSRFSGYQSDVLCQRAAEWIQTERRPWFCVVSLEAPHPPYFPSPAGVKLRQPGAVHLRPNVPQGGDCAAKARSELSGYYAHIEGTDRAVGHLLGNLDPLRTAVVFTSVHGDMHGSHGLFRKGWPHEESVRVPLVVAGPGTTAGRSQAPVSLVDLPALTLSLAESGKLSIPAADHALISMPSVVALPHQCDRPWRGLRTAEWKLVLSEDDKPWLFFHLAKDPFEERNLVSNTASAADLTAWVSRLTHAPAAARPHIPL